MPTYDEIIKSGKFMELSEKEMEYFIKERLKELDPVIEYHHKNSLVRGMCFEPCVICDNLRVIKASKFVREKYQDALNNLADK